MTPNEYQELAMSKEADQEAIRQRVYSHGIQATRLENGLRGLTDEVGELAGAVKAWLEYGKPLDVSNVLEECGDVLWRTAQILLAIDCSMGQAMEANLRKLSVRYEGRCTDSEAANRNLKAERQAILSASLGESLALMGERK